MKNTKNKLQVYEIVCSWSGKYLGTKFCLGEEHKYSTSHSISYISQREYLRKKPKELIGLETILGFQLKPSLSKKFIDDVNHYYNFEI